MCLDSAASLQCYRAERDHDGGSKDVDGLVQERCAVGNLARCRCCVVPLLVLGVAQYGISDKHLVPADTDLLDQLLEVVAGLVTVEWQVRPVCAQAAWGLTNKHERCVQWTATWPKHPRAALHPRALLACANSINQVEELGFFVIFGFHWIKERSCCCEQSK